MKTLSERQALEQIEQIKSDYRNFIKSAYETRAKSCLVCETQGACCLDEHFVNVHITRLEAVAMKKNLQRFSKEKQEEIYRRISETIEKYRLENSENFFAQTYACPLYEKGLGCLVHQVKPVPCIQHACYERREDLPPDELQTETEEKIARLNEKTYHQNAKWLPLPVWLKRI